VLHLFISNHGPHSSRLRPVLLSAAAHAVLLAMIVTPYRPAHFATIPRAVGESIQRIELSAGVSRHDRAAPLHRRARLLPRSPVLPLFVGFDLSLAMNVVEVQPVLPEPDLPRMADSLWGDAPGMSALRSPSIASADSGVGFGGGLDSMAFIAANVDRVAESEGVNPKPAYPVDLLNRLVEAQFSVYFVVDTTGRIDVATIQVPPSVDRRFAQAVRDVLVRWHFVPAEIRGRRVRQLMEQPFQFRIVNGQYT
jgi:TonB family protein